MSGDTGLRFEAVERIEGNFFENFFQKSEDTNRQVLKRLKGEQISEEEWKELCYSICNKGGTSVQQVVNRSSSFVQIHSIGCEKVLLVDEMKISLFELIHDFTRTCFFDRKLKQSIAIDILKGIEHLESHGFVHGNLKPSNIFLDHLNTTKISYFGDLLSTNQRSQPNFNIRWSAPEVFGKGELTCKADIYSFGIIYWEMLSREIPFSQYQDSELENQIKSGCRPSLNFSHPLFESITKVLNKCWDKFPQNRPSTQEAIQKVREITDNLKPSQRPTKTDVTAHLKNDFQILLDQTCDSTRKIGVGRDVKDIRSPYNRLEVEQIFKIDSRFLWQIYEEEKEIVKETFTSQDSKTCLEKLFGGSTDHWLNNLDNGCNEKYLFSGTKESNVDPIIQTGFQAELSKKGAFGEGIYLTDESAKADHYATDETVEPQNGCYYMFLVRTIMGNTYDPKTTFPKTETIKCIKTVPNVKENTHSLWVKHDLKNSPIHRYDEMVTFVNKRCFPEYLICYKRVLKKSNEIVFHWRHHTAPPHEIQGLINDSKYPSKVSMEQGCCELNFKDEAEKKFNFFKERRSNRTWMDTFWGYWYGVEYPPIPYWKLHPQGIEGLYQVTNKRVKLGDSKLITWSERSRPVEDEVYPFFKDYESRDDQYYQHLKAKSGELIEPNVSQHPDSPQVNKLSISLSKFLAEKEGAGIAILGEPGIGKSSALFFFYKMEWEKFKNQKQNQQDKWIPFWISIEGFQIKIDELKHQKKVSSAFECYLDTLCPRRSSFLENYKFLLFLDGFDEITYESEIPFFKATGLESFRKKHDGSKFIISSRKSSTSRFNFGLHLAELYIVPFSSDQARELIHKHEDKQGKFPEGYVSIILNRFPFIYSRPFFLSQIGAGASNYSKNKDNEGLFLEAILMKWFQSKADTKRESFDFAWNLQNNPRSERNNLLSKPMPEIFFEKTFQQILLARLLATIIGAFTPMNRDNWKMILSEIGYQIDGPMGLPINRSKLVSIDSNTITYLKQFLDNKQINQRALTDSITHLIHLSRNNDNNTTFKFGAANALSIFVSLGGERQDGVIEKLDLSCCNVEGADMSGCCFIDCNFECCRLTEAQISDSVFSRCTFSGAYIDSIHFKTSPNTQKKIFSLNKVCQDFSTNCKVIKGTFKPIFSEPFIWRAPDILISSPLCENVDQVRTNSTEKEVLMTYKSNNHNNTNLISQFVFEDDSWVLKATNLQVLVFENCKFELSQFKALKLLEYVSEPNYCQAWFRNDSYKLARLEAEFNLREYKKKTEKVGIQADELEGNLCVFFRLQASSLLQHPFCYKVFDLFEPEDLITIITNYWPLEIITFRKNDPPSPDIYLPALMWTVSKKKYQFMTWLTEKVNASQLWRGQNALHLACIQGDLTAVNILLKGGSDPTVPDSSMNSPLHLACKQGSESVCKALLTELTKQQDTQNRCNVTDASQNTALHYACLNGFQDLVTLLLESGAYCDNQNKDKKTPLFVAVEQAHLGVINQLLNNNASPNIPDKNQNTPLHIACLKGSSDIVEELLKKKANVNTPNQGKETPLHLACHRGFSHIVGLLLNKKANPDAPDRNNSTPVREACLVRNFEILSMLLHKSKYPQLSWGSQSVSDFFEDKTLKFLAESFPTLKFN